MGAFRCMGIFAAVFVIVGCASPLDLAGYPLYPDVGRRLARYEVARLYGPIARVDDRDVSTLGDAFELMPGCHSVRTRDDPVPNTFGRSRAGGGFRFGARSFVLSMKGGHAYVLRRLRSAAGVGVYIEEHDASGAWSKDVHPGDGAACQSGSGALDASATAVATNTLRGYVAMPKLWLNSERSRSALGYPATIRYLEGKIRRCHPSNVDYVRDDLESAHRGEGQTLFEILVGIIRTHGPRTRLVHAAFAVEGGRTAAA